MMFTHYLEEDQYEDQEQTEEQELSAYSLLVVLAAMAVFCLVIKAIEFAG